MAVDIHCKGNRAVTEGFADRLRHGSARQRHAGIAMAQVVKTDAADPRSGGNLPDRPLSLLSCKATGSYELIVILRWIRVNSEVLLV